MKKLKIVAMAFIAFTMCVNFSACNKDDDGPNFKDLIIGTWISEDGEIYYFEKNGTGEYEFEEGYYSYYEEFKWDISDNKLILESEEDDKEEYTIITLTEDKLVIEYEDGKDSFTSTLTKKGSNNYEKLILGTWSDGDWTYTFNANGTGTEREDGEGSDSFEWRISGNKITLDFKDGYPDSYTIESLTEDKLVWSIQDGGNTYRETYSKK